MTVYKTRTVQQSKRPQAITVGNKSQLFFYRRELNTYIRGSTVLIQHLYIKDRTNETLIKGTVVEYVHYAQKQDTSSFVYVRPQNSLYKIENIITVMKALCHSCLSSNMDCVINEKGKPDCLICRTSKK